MIAKASKGKDERFVIPGERLGVIEEFVAGAGAYVENGVIYSEIIGHSQLDLQGKSATVRPLARTVKVPRIGSVVLSRVTNVQKQNAFVRIFQVDETKLLGFFSGILHVSDVRLRFVESMFNICKPGDLVRARVIGDKNNVFHLTIKDKNLGVIHASCSRCGHILQHSRYRMRCLTCGRIEKRKTAFDYGEATVT